MATTLETQVANVANGIIATVSQAATLKLQIDQLSAAWTNLGAANLLNLFPTTAATTTGGLGTADVSPNVAHPIDTRTAVGGEISRALSANDIASMLTFIQGVSNVVGGSAVSTNGAAVSLLAKSS